MMYPMIRLNTAPIARPRYMRTMDDFFRPFTVTSNHMRTDIKETEDAYLFAAEMPGFENDEINISVKDSMLSIEAEHKDESGDEGAFSSRSVKRSFTLEGIDEEGIAAEYKNGVLRITLPKEKSEDEPEARRIEVR